MSRVGSNAINLDDIFGAIDVNPTTVKAEPSPLSRKQSSSSNSTIVQAQQTQPTKRTSVTKEKITVSNNNNITKTTTKTYSAYYDNSYQPSVTGNDSLLNEVFNAVHLEEVHLGNVPEGVNEIDNVLAGEESESISSEPRYIAPSRKSSKANSVHDNYYAYAPETAHSKTPSIVSTASRKNAANKAASEVMHGVFDNLNLEEKTYNPYADGPEDHHDEHHDNFNQHYDYEPRKHTAAIRSRTNTIDSHVSYAESRFGSFDVHDDRDKYTGSVINLNHNEVAYQRVSAPNTPLSTVSRASGKSIHTGGTEKLHRIQKNLNEARQKRVELAHLIEKQRNMNDIQRRNNLALEASIKRREQQEKQQQQQHQIGTGVGYAYKSYDPYEDDNVPHSRSQSHASHRSESSIYEEEPVAISDIASIQRDAGDHIATHGKYELIVPQYYVIRNFSKNSKINKVILGGDAEPTEEDKTVLLFGPVGSGKTSLISSMMNYLYDVKKENNFRFVIDEEVTSTNGLTAYVFTNTILPYNVTIVDTPGVKDVMNKRDVSTLIKTWFEEELLREKAFRLDAISIVLRHDENKLGWPFIHELADVKRMFGDDLKSNVMPIITHSKVLPQPIAIKSLARANISFLEYYKINNSGFAAIPHGVTKLEHNLFFTHGMASFENFFTDLQEQVHPLVAILRHDKGKKVDTSRTLQNATLY